MAKNKGYSKKKYYKTKSKSAYDRKQDKLIKKLMDSVETKNNDFNISTLTSNLGTPTVVHLSGIAQGSDYSDRIGRQILCKKILFKYTISQSASASTDPQVVRVTLVRDMKSDSVIPTYINVFGSNGLYDFVQRGNLQNRFSILYDKYHVVSLDSTGDVDNSYTGNDIGYINIKYKLGSKIEYSGTGASSYGSGCYFLMLNDNDGAAPPTITGKARIYYEDA